MVLEDWTEETSSQTSHKFFVSQVKRELQQKNERGRGTTHPSKGAFKVYRLPFQRLFIDASQTATLSPATFRSHSSANVHLSFLKWNVTKIQCNDSTEFGTVGIFSLSSCLLDSMSRQKRL